MLTAVASSPVKRQPEAVVGPAALAAAVGAVVAVVENTQLIHAMIIKKIIKTRLVKKEKLRRKRKMKAYSEKFAWGTDKDPLACNRKMELV